MIRPFYPIQWPDAMPQTKNRSIVKHPAYWADEYGHIARLSRLSKWRQCVVSSNFNPDISKIDGDNRGVVVLIENERGLKMVYACDKYYNPSANLREIRKRLDADRTISKLYVRAMLYEDRNKVVK